MPVEQTVRLMKYLYPPFRASKQAGSIYLRGKTVVQLCEVLLFLMAWLEFLWRSRSRYA